ncbi:uncharacterized protein BP5553_01147 [Venustampulla echinocandica]|uniref:Uncharacterized protein n=1 Tax=Venustampulla echinocandica TaxID=2656787 RepID=A0A370U068_9HELO|nr:uncharacterized protein BP5553_01147 [Venustampulla echinocandica]RDL41168.1 hypothetical protein BP5553_01147 [Venustampulla echinocandica]
MAPSPMYRTPKSTTPLPTRYKRKTACRKATTTKDITSTDITEATNHLQLEHSVSAIAAQSLQGRFALTFGKLLVEHKSTTTSQNISAQKLYRAAMHKSCFFFIAFALCVSPRACRRTKKLQLLIDTHKPTKFILNETTIETFQNWAREGNYDQSDLFVHFITTLIPARHNCYKGPEYEPDSD